MLEQRAAVGNRTTRLCSSVFLWCCGIAACSPPPPLPTASTGAPDIRGQAAPPNPVVETSVEAVPEAPYDVGSEGRFPPPPDVAPRAARGRHATRERRGSDGGSAAASDARSDATTPAASAESPVHALGFRVQVAASGSEESAQEARRRVVESIAAAVYIEHEPPYYKVRVGDCPTQNECRQLMEQLKASGWESAWVVRTRILAP